MENFNTLVATVSGASVFLSWKLNSVPSPVSVVLQRSPYGSDNSAWTDVVSLPVTTLSYTATPPAPGTYAYRLKVTSTQGSVDALLTLFFSNNVNVSTYPATGVITLTATTSPASNNTGTAVNLAWNNLPVGIALDFQVERSLNGGATWQIPHNEPDDEAVVWNEILVTGLGMVQYRVRAFLPPEQVGNPANFPQTLSNVVSVTI